MSHVTATRIATLAGLLAVALGAFGAHSLKTLLQAHQMTAVWEKAVFYQFIHTVMLFFLASRPTLQRGPWYSFLIGIVLFSGSLYLLALTHLRWLGAITPFGGLSFIVGWGWLFLSAARTPRG